MKQMPFFIWLNDDELSDSALKNLMEAVSDSLTLSGASGFSVWRAEHILFGYYELWESAPLPDRSSAKVREMIENALGSHAVLLASPGNMRLVFNMVHDPVKDKSNMSYRVFMIRVKPGCAEEYRLRHEKLLKDMGELKGCLNFTCWQAGDYICGYSETPASDSPEESSTESGGNAEWEYYMLQIMDWITNDADRFSGETHEPVRLICMGPRCSEN